MKQKILLIHNFYRLRGGEDQVVENELELLRQNGHEVDTLFFHSNTIESTQDKLRTAWELPHSERAVELLRQKVTASKPDLIHVHNFYPLATTAIHRTAHALKIPVVQTLHNFRLTCLNALLFRAGKNCELCVGNFPLPGLLHRCYQDSLPASLAMARMNQANQNVWQTDVSQFIALSHFAKKIFVRAGIPEQKISVKPNFIHPTKPSPMANSDFAKQEYALYLGRMSEEKGPQILLESWSKGGPGKLVLVGDGPLLPELKKKYAKHSNISFLGARPREEALAILAKAKFAVIPSLCYENFPMVLLEAMFAGVPIMAAAKGSISEILQDGKLGVLFNPDADHDSLLNAAKKLWENKTAREACAKEALAVAEREYTPEANYKCLLEIYEKADQ